MASLLRPLAALALLAVVLPTASAQNAFANHPVVDHPAGVHVLTLAPDGSMHCDQAEEAAVAEQLTARRGQVQLTAVNSTNPVGSTKFRIILRATDQLLAQPEALLSFRRGAARWERIIQSEVTTVIDVDYGTSRFGTPYPTGVLGSTGSAIRGSGLNPASAVAKFKSLTSDPQLIELYDAIPVPTPSTLRDPAFPNNPVNLASMLAGTIPLQVYGILPAELPANTFETVPSIGFNSAFAFDFDPRDGISSSAFDFEGVVIHEIGHALGFVSVIGNSSVSNPIFFPWDLFRVRPDAVEANESLGDGVGWEVAERVVTPGPVETEVLETIEGVTFFRAVQVFFDGLTLLETSTATGAGDGGDGNQASHWRDDSRRSPKFGPQRKIGIMDPNTGRGELDEITDNDIRLLEVIGFSVDYDPESAEASYALDGEFVDTESQILITRSYGLADVGEGQPGTATLTVSNLDPAVDLAYEVEFIQGEIVSAGEAPAVSVTLANEVGTVAPGGDADVTVTYSASGPALVNGTLLLRSNDESQYVVALPVAFAAGDVAFPTLQATGITQEAVAETQRPLTVEVQNPSSIAGLGYLRILEPAISVGPPGFTPQPPAARRAQGAQEVDTSQQPTEVGAQARTAQGVLASVALPNATQPFAITELGDGRLLISDLNLAGPQVTRALYLVSSDLGTVTEIATPVTPLVTGIAYDERTGNVWLGDFLGEVMREATVVGNTVTLTGTTVALGFRPTSMSYSAELDAFFSIGDRSDTVYAFDRSGNAIPGYPIDIPPISATASRASFNAQSFREGVLEVKGFSNELRQYDQFGRDFEGSERTVFEAGGTELMGGTGFSGYVRSRLDYNDRAFYLVNQANAASDFFLLEVDPPDFPARVGTVLDATERAAVSGTLPAGGSASLTFELDTRGRSAEEIDEVLAYLTNNPSEPIVTIPVDLSVRPVATEGETPDAFTVIGAVPNPVPGTGGAVRLRLAQASEVTVTVYNVLGQRVAVLAQDAPLAIGTHDLPLGAGGLAAGTYLIRVQAGTEVETQTMTVVR